MFRDTATNPPGRATNALSRLIVHAAPMTNNGVGRRPATCYLLVAAPLASHKVASVLWISIKKVLNFCRLNLWHIGALGGTSVSLMLMYCSKVSSVFENWWCL